MPKKRKAKKQASGGKAANVTTIRAIRKLPCIKTLLKNVDAKGRCKLSGRTKANPPAGKCLLIFREEEMALVSFKAGARCPIVYEYDKTCNSELGKEVAKALARAGLACKFNGLR